MTQYTDNKQPLHPKRLAARLLIYVTTLLFTLSTIAQPFAPTSSAVTVPSTSPGLTVGAYNVYSCHYGHNYKQRMQTVAKNIVQLGYDVVGMSEYNHQTCWNTLLDELNKLGGQWNHTQQTRKDYTANQASIVWNASSVTLVPGTDEIFDMDIGEATTSANKSTHDCGSCSGGSRYMHIARFKDNSGKEFVFANGHFLTFDSNAAAHRVKELTHAMNRLKAETVPVFIVGDMNSSPSRSSDNVFFTSAKNGGYSFARTTALNIVNSLWGTMTSSSTKGEYAIDQIFYKNVAPPSYYETFGCKSLGECGSDHRPIKAVFSDLTGSGGALNCTTTPSSNTSSPQDPTNPMLLNYYRTHNNIPFTGGSEVCCSSGVVSGDLIGNTNAEKAYHFLVSNPIATNGGKPLTSAQAAGAVGNLMRESAGDTYDLNTNPPGNTTHYGIVQWGGTRWTNPNAKVITGLKEFATTEGKDWKDFQVQLKFIIYELERTEPAVIKDSAFKNASNDEAGAKIAAARWDHFYERSGGQGLTKRQENAVKVFNEFGDPTAATVPNEEVSEIVPDGSALALSSSTTSGGCPSSSVSSGEYVFPLDASKADLRKWGADPGTTEWKSGRYHEDVFPGYLAVDIMAPEGTPVLAFHAGKVIDVGVDGNAFGALNVQIQDTEGYTYYYQHLSASKGAKVKVGDQVTAGTLLAYVGNDREGWCAAPGYRCGGKQSHLHLDKSKNPGSGKRGTCSARNNNCPIAKEGRFAPIVVELHNSFELIAEQGPGNGLNL